MERTDVPGTGVAADRPASGDTHVTAGVDVQRRGEQVDG
jgi:hypothetical protein